MTEKGLPTDRWAFYIMDEPAPGEERQEVIAFAREVKKADPRVRTYITFPVGRGDDAENLEIARHVDIVQVIGDASPEVMREVRSTVKEFWRYSILTRSSSPFHSYRKGVCWDALREGCVGTGFWVWDSQGQDDFLWRDQTRALFPAVYSHHDRTVIPSLRAEAFREGIEDWKYVLMLDEAIARAKQKRLEGAVVTEAEAYRARCLSELDEADSAYRFRDATRSHLLRLHEALGDLERTQVEAVEAE